MTISVPTTLALVSTNITDDTMPYDNTIQQNFPLDSSVKYQDSIYYAPKQINVPTYDSQNTYSVGDVVFKDNFIKKLTADTLGEVPKQPESYSAFDTSFDHTLWSERYMKLGGAWTGYPTTPYYVEHVIGNDKIIHTVSLNTNQQFDYETKAVVDNTANEVVTTGVINASNVIQTAGSGADWYDLTEIYTQNDVGAKVPVSDGGYSEYIISRHDLSSIPDTATITGIEVTVRRRVNIYAGDGVRDTNIYLFNNTTIISSNRSSSTFWGLNWTEQTFGSPTDLWGLASPTPATLKNSLFGFGMRMYNSRAGSAIIAELDIVKMKVHYIPTTITKVLASSTPTLIPEITPLTNAVKASITNPTVYPNYAHAFNTLVIRPDGVYGRTHTDAVVEYETVIGSFFSIAEKPQDIGFVLIGKSDPYKPFDNKNYTKATRDSNIQYVVKGTIKFDTLALGHLKADSVLVEFRDSNSNLIKSINQVVDSSRDSFDYLEKYHTTIILYSEQVMEANSTVSITITGTDCEIGTIMLGQSVDAGFTNLNLKNTYKDFSVIQEDEWGNVDYVERAKVSKYDGSVDIMITDYDRIDRLMTSIGARLIILNGSDSLNQISDSQNIFASTQKIGRIRGFQQQTKVKDNDMDRTATYTFSLEEIV